MEFIICIFIAPYSRGRNSWDWSLTAIVTAASIGIGTETVRVLALRGVHVPMGIRSMASGKEVKEAIVK